MNHSIPNYGLTEYFQYIWFINPNYLDGAFSFGFFICTCARPFLLNKSLLKTFGTVLVFLVGNACLKSCADAGETHDSNGDHQCDSNCADMGLILNSVGDKCVPDCSLLGHILNSQETQCLPNCASGGEVLNAIGDACLISCSFAGETTDADGNNQCDANCAAIGEVLNAAGDSCLTDCGSAGEMEDIDGNNQCENTTTTVTTSKKFYNYF